MILNRNIVYLLRGRLSEKRESVLASHYFLFCSCCYCPFISLRFGVLCAVGVATDVRGVDSLQRLWFLRLERSKFCEVVSLSSF